MSESQGHLDRLLKFLGFFRELNLDVSIEEFLSAEKAFTYADLDARLRNSGDTAVWLTPHAAVTLHYGLVMQSWIKHRVYRESLHYVLLLVDGNAVNVLASSLEHLRESCDVVLRLLAASVVHSVRLDKFISADDGDVSINAPTLAHLMEQCQSLKSLSLNGLALDEHHCRVFGAYSRPDLEIELKGCAITGSGASKLNRYIL
jgi:hypothetical protein